MEVTLTNLFFNITFKDKEIAVPIDHMTKFLLDNCYIENIHEIYQRKESHKEFAIAYVNRLAFLINRTINKPIAQRSTLEMVEAFIEDVNEDIEIENLSNIDV